MEAEAADEASPDNRARGPETIGPFGRSEGAEVLAARCLLRVVRLRSVTMAGVVLGPVRARLLDGGLMVSLGRELDLRRPGVGGAGRGDDWR